MGLDNYMQRTAKSPKELSFPSDLRLCGGMFSGHGGEGSFRGKVYDEIFSEITGMSLYSNLSPEQVQQASEKLVSWVECASLVHSGKESVPGERRYSVEFEEIRDLSRLFQSASEQKCKMVAWY